MLPPMPSLNQTLVLLQQQERQRSHSSSTRVVEAATLLTKGTNTRSFKSQKSSYGNKNNEGRKKLNLECLCYHGTNHTRERCFHILGFPPKQKSKTQAGSGSSSGGKVSQVSTGTISDSVEANVARSGTSKFFHFSYSDPIPANL